MKKFKFVLPLLLFVPFVALFAGCGVETKYVSPTVSVNEITTSSLEKSINLAARSTVSVYATGKTLSGTILGAGSGVIYSLDKNTGNAYIVTNAHNVYDSDFLTSDSIASQIWIETYGSEGTFVTEKNGGSEIVYGEQAISCSCIGLSVENDIAVLKASKSDILKSDFPKATEISSAPAHLGQSVFAFGNALGQHLSATTGVVSVESEYIRYSDFEDLVIRCIRTDAPINNGNSGGGLFDETGKLLGICNAGVDDAENIGSAIPISIVTGVADNIIYGYETKSYSNLKQYSLGFDVVGKNSKAVYDSTLELSVIKEEIYVANATFGNKVQNGDMIVAAKINNGSDINFSRSFEFEEFLLKLRPGDTLTLFVIRSGASRSIEIKV